MCCSGGNACPVVNGTTRLTTPCVNYNPCPVNCTASWQFNGNCTDQCSGGVGFIPEVCFISASASAAAPATAAAAAFKLRSACVPELGAAVLPILQKTQAVVQHSMPCCRTSPIDTSPHMLVYAACACTNPFQLALSLYMQCCRNPQVFNVSSPAMYGGSCPYTNGTTRLTLPCTNSIPCPPQDCVGSWVAGSCSGDCGGGEGLLLEEFKVTVTAAYNGEAVRI